MTTIETLETIEAEVNSLHVSKAAFERLNQLIRLAKAQHQNEVLEAEVETMRDCIKRIGGQKRGK